MTPDSTYVFRCSVSVRGSKLMLDISLLRTNVYINIQEDGNLLFGLQAILVPDVSLTDSS